ncbi:uncharacterized protein [Paramisgurnus dabryanus]|uniref:uncharacterized protein isoform X2 n=1 Tax=Paramisgurnus dabryanus TaxID=90735 RepID=UPI003CCFDC69
MMDITSRRRRLKPLRDAEYHINSRTDKPYLQQQYINRFKGRGVFTKEFIWKGDFVVEYNGKLLTQEQGDLKGKQCAESRVFLFDFEWRGQMWCMDASEEDGRLGRLVNDDHRKPNCKMKVIAVNNRPHLCLFSIDEILPGGELTYDYGPSDWPWRPQRIITVTSQTSESRLHKSSEEMITDVATTETFTPCVPEASSQQMITDVVTTETFTPCVPEASSHQMITDVATTETFTPCGPEASSQQMITDVATTETFTPCVPEASSQQCHKHDFVHATVSSLDKCKICLGSGLSAFKWIGFSCKVCSGVWHKDCLQKTVPEDKHDFSSEDNQSDEDMHEDDMHKDDDYVPDTDSESDSDTSTVVGSSVSQVPLSRNIEEFHTTTKNTCENTDETTDEATEARVNGINYCYVCQKPQSKLARHLEMHKTEAEVMEALSYPKRSVNRRRLLEKLRNRGNFQHNLEVLKNGTGQIKLKRFSKQSKFIHCLYCKGMFSRKELWRHTRRCHFMPERASHESTKAKVLGLATTAQSVFSESISKGVWKLLDPMRQDDITAVVRNDFGILQLAQTLYNKHGNDPTKHEYVRQKLRELARVLLVLRGDSIYTIEDAVKPGNFYKVVNAVKKVSGFDEENHTYTAPSLALKIGHSLQKIADIIYSRALMTENDNLIKSTEAFKSLYAAKWCELVSHSALNTLSEKKFNKPSTLPFTQDVQLLHTHLEKTSESAFDKLKKTVSPQSYADLAKSTLAQIIIFNRRRAGEVSKMRLKNFIERDKSPLHADVSLGLTKFEKKLCEHFSRVEIRGKRGRKVAVLLTPFMVESLNLLVSKRMECGVPDTNIFLFARPQCSTYYRGQDCLRLHAEKCGAKKPEYLRSTQLRKHVATLSQILNLKENELDQVADFLGHDIRVHREHYRLPEATIQLAKISKLLLAMDKGCLGSIQGKSLDEIQIEDQIQLTDTEDDAGDEPAGTSSLDKEVSTSPQEACQNEVIGSVEHRGTADKKKRMWSKAEVAAVMRHFKVHIVKGNLATKSECLQCKSAEEPVLQNRSVQNIRDFVRNRGITAKRRSQYESAVSP